MEKRNYEIKNRAQATMTDLGPYNTTRKKSKDGRYTADLEVEDEYWDKARQVSERAHEDDEDEINNKVYEPIFVNTLDKTILQHLRNVKEPNQDVYLIKSNSWNDKRRGIDFQLGLRIKNKNGTTIGFDAKTLSTIDLKVVDTFGKSTYEEPSLSINLWKNYGEKPEDWEANSFMNKNHINNVYAWIVPKTDESKQHIQNRLKENPDYSPYVYRSKLYWIRKSVIDNYVQSRLLNNEHVKNLIEAYKNDDLDSIRSKSKNVLHADTRETSPDTFEISIPVAGETFKATLVMKKRPTGYREIRMFLPAKSFDSGLKGKGFYKEVKF